MYEVGQQFEAQTKRATTGEDFTFIVILINISNDNILTLKSVKTHFNGSLNQLHNGGGSYDYITGKVKIHDDGSMELVKNWQYEYDLSV